MTNPAFTTPNFKIDSSLSEDGLSAVLHAKRSLELGSSHKDICEETAMFYPDDDKVLMAVHRFLEDNLIETYKATFNQRPWSELDDDASMIAADTESETDIRAA